MTRTLSIEEVIAGVPAWAGRDVRAEEISGGLTNRNYRIHVDDERFCVRIPGADSSLLAIDRQVEYRNTLAAAASGAGAAVIATVGDLPVMVLEWIEGVPQDAGSLRAHPRAVEFIADGCRRLHDGPAFVNRFDMFRIQEGYLRLVRERGFEIPDDFAEFMPLVRRIEEAMAVQPAPLAPCNNDLLAANYIDTGDGFRLIDYEYSGMNDPCFELGNTVAESELGDEVLERIVERYFGAPLRNRVARAQLWSVMSNYGWTLWACIQRAISDIDFDFWEWGVDGKYARAKEAFTGPDLPVWLEQVQRAD